MAVITADIRDLEKMTKFLKKNSRNGGAVAIAIQQTLNDLAFRTKNRAIKRTIPRVMTVRNKTYVRMSMAVQKIPKGKKISEMESRMGALEKKNGKKLLGWKAMEEGSKVKSPYKGKHGYHATLYARGGTKQGKVRIKKRISNLNAILSPQSHVNHPSTNKKILQRQMIKTMIVTKNKSPFYLTINGEKGIYEMKGTRLKKLYAIGKKTYALSKRSWLDPATKDTVRIANKLYFLNAEKQIKRLSNKLKIQYRG